MTCSISTTEPTRLTQGERVQWTREFCDYSSTLYTAKWVFRGPGTGFTVNGTVDGTHFDAELTAAQTAAMAVGKWQWWAYVTEIANAANVISCGSGYVQVYQGAPVGTGAIETRTPAEIQLAAIDAELASIGSITEYELSTPAGSRRVKKRTDLLNDRKYWANIVYREKHGNQIQTMQTRMPG